MTIKNREILLSVMQEGRVVRSVKEVEEKVTYSYNKRVIKNGKVEIDPKTITESAVVKMKPLIPTECKSNTKLSIAFTNFAISDECPQKCKKGDWMKMSEKSRLEFHLNKIAGGKKFSYELI